MTEYDYLIVGAGLFGSVFAYKAKELDKKVLVIDQRNHIGGNCYTEKQSNIDVHKYGAHIFHTDNEEVWKFINQFGKFNNFINSPVAIVNGVTYNLPFNMNTFSKIFNVSSPSQVQAIIDQERSIYKDLPTNLEEQALRSVGKTIYELLIKNYTEKQWGKKCTELPLDIITRLPLRFTYDNNYFNDKYQGIPENGYTALFEKMLKGIEVRLNTKYQDTFNADKIIYTGMIDEFFSYCYGQLEYRSLKFVEIEKNTKNWQGNAVINYPNNDVGYIRTIEHKHFTQVDTPNTVVSYEFSVDYKPGMIPFYPVKTKENQRIYERYLNLAEGLPNVYFSGRLGSFKYYDMDDTINNALQLFNSLSDK